MKHINKTIVARRQSTNPALRNVLHALELGASVKVKSDDVARLAGSLSRTTKRVDGTRFAVRALCTGGYKVTRVKAEKIPTYQTNNQTKEQKFLDIVSKLRNLVREEIALLEALS